MENNLLLFGDVINDASLEKYNTYGIKTSCDYLGKPSNVNNLIELLNYLNKNSIEFYLIGKGSNIILPDSKLKGVIISLENLNNIERKDNYISVEAGRLLSSFSKYCIDNKLSGFEYLATIPGTIGGALYGNAGVKDHEIYDNLVSIDIIRDNKLISLEKSEIDFSYRDTEFKHNKNDIIVRATFKLNCGNKEEMENIVKESRLKRINSQPLEYKNAGSVFKNPEGNYAGKLIEEVGLKGFNVNDAEVSNKHANFIINKGNATSKDIKELIKIIQKKVYEEKNIKLELEQIIVEWD